MANSRIRATGSRDFETTASKVFLFLMLIILPISTSAQDSDLFDFDADSLIMYEYQVAESWLQENRSSTYRIKMGGSFDDLLEQAPPLDPADSSFHKGNAYHWVEVVDQQYRHLIHHSISDDMRAIVNDMRTAELAPNPYGGLQNIRERLMQFSPRNGSRAADYDFFAKTFFLIHVHNTIRRIEISIDLERLCESLNTTPTRESLKAAANTFRGWSTELREMAYQPTPAPVHVQGNIALWKALARLAEQAEAASVLTIIDDEDPNSPEAQPDQDLLYRQLLTGIMQNETPTVTAAITPRLHWKILAS